MLQRLRSDVGEFRKLRAVAEAAQRELDAASELAGQVRQAAETAAQVAEESRSYSRVARDSASDASQRAEMAGQRAQAGAIEARSSADNARACAAAVGMSLERANSAEEAARSARQAADRAAALSDLCSHAAEKCASASEQTARASERSAAQSEETLAMTKTMVELGRRAWVHAADFHFLNGPRPDETTILEVWISNMGSTPALDLVLTSKFQLCDEVPDELAFTPRQRNITLAPAAKTGTNHTLKLSPANLSEIRTGKKLLLAFGQVDYQDIFGVARQTRWCAQYDQAAGAFITARKHNFST